MNWVKTKFKNWFALQCNEAIYGVCQPETEPSPQLIQAKNEIIDNRTSYTVRMQPANGGTILEVSHYDQKQGEYNRDLYIVTEGSDLGTEISQILVQYKLTHS